jgi:hypothetical protein
MAFSVQDAFMTKVGPLPAIAWAGMAGGAFVVYKYATRDNGTTVTTVGDSVPDYASGGVGGADDFGDGYGNAVFSGTAPGTALNGQPSQAVQTNSDWGKRASDYLIAQGVNPTDAQMAISTYLFGTGQQLNTVQSAALQTALRVFGTPPEGVIIPPPTTTPTVEQEEELPNNVQPGTPYTGINPTTNQIDMALWQDLSAADRSAMLAQGYLPPKDWQLVP